MVNVRRMMMMMMMMMMRMTRTPIKVLVRDSRRAVITTSKVEVAVAIRRPVQIVRSMDMRSTDMIGRDAI